MQSLESIHNKIMNKFKILSDIAIILDDDAIEINMLKQKYINNTVHLFHLHYIANKPQENALMQYISTEDIVGKLNKIFIQFKERKRVTVIDDYNKLKNLSITEKFKQMKRKSIKKLQTITDKRYDKLETNEILSNLYDMFNQNFIKTINKNDKQNYCLDCNTAMRIMTNMSEIQCDNCGLVIFINGILADENIPYNNKVSNLRVKMHDTNRHCKKWLIQIQGKENIEIKDEYIDLLYERAVQDYTRGGVLRSMDDLKCCTVREWLKELRLTEFNDNAPLIRKLITEKHGNTIHPPQLTNEEEFSILLEFSKSMFIYDKIKEDKELLSRYNKEKISNKFYYPFCILKIIEFRFKYDVRLPKIIECIHIQSSSTVLKNDKIWELICKDPNIDIKFKATDRTKLC